MGLSHGIGVGIPFIRSGGFCSQYQSVWDAFPNKPTSAQSSNYNWFAKNLYDNGLWSIWDIIRVYGVHTNTASEALLNWANPALYAATREGATPPVFTKDQGFTFDGATGYLHQRWVPATNGVNFTQNSASQVLYIRTNITGSTRHGANANADTKDCMFEPRRATNLAYIRTNDGTSANAANTDGSGLFVNTRTAAAVNKLYRNGTAIINATTASTGRPTVAPFTGAADNDGVADSFRADQVFFEAWGAGPTQAQVTTLTSIVNQFATLLGVNVF